MKALNVFMLLMFGTFLLSLFFALGLLNPRGHSTPVHVARPYSSVTSCLQRVEASVGLPAQWNVLTISNVTLALHDPWSEFISNWAREQKNWWSSTVPEVIRNHMPPEYRHLVPSKLGYLLEIGTNIGTASVPIAIDLQIQVITVEADVENYRRVSLTRCLNGDRLKHYTSFHRACVKEDKEEVVFIRRWGGNMGGSFVDPQFTGHVENGALERTRTVTIDSIAYREGSMASADYGNVNPLAPVWAIKLDCEGCEGSAIVGAKKLLRDPERHPIAIYIEIIPKYLARGGTDLKGLYDALRDAKYQSTCMRSNEPWDKKWHDEITKGHYSTDCMWYKLDRILAPRQGIQILG